MNTALPPDIQIIDDLHLGRPHVIATYALLGDQPALVDPGPANTLPNLAAGLASHGLGFSDLRAILLTHIHLDHAGATGTLVARNPGLKVYVHQRGAPHLIAPEKLIRSATRLYGDLMEQLWGEFLAVPEANITTLAGGETIRLGNRSLRVFDAPGHASHHVNYLDDGSGAAFVGDNGGIRIPIMQHGTPATPPPDIDIEAWDTTLATLAGLAPQMLLLTHFGPAFDAAEHIADYRARLAQWAEFVRAGLQSGADEASQIERLADLAEGALPADTSPADRTAFRMAAPIDQCWQGLARYWRKRAEAV